MSDLLDTLLAACHAGLETHGGLLGGLWLTGLLGSLIHCGPMCGPLVLAQVGARIADLPAGPGSETRRRALALLLPYHLGRGLTYAGLGAAAAALAGLAETQSGLRGLSAALLGLGALMLLAMATGGGSGGGGRIGRALTRLATPLLGAPEGWRGFALGVLLGFLPCGLVQAALAASASAGSAASGAFAMLAFWAGTVPMLVAIALAGQAMWGRLHHRLARFAPWVLGANALLLAALAVRVAVGAPEPVAFTLLNTQGEAVTEASFAGRPLLIYFGYTYCPDVCPTSLGTLADALERLPPATRDRLVPLFVTIDPERDSPARAAAYAAAFSPRLVGLGGEPAEIAAMTARFAVPVSRVEGADAESYTLDHGSLFHLVGIDRRIAARLADRAAPEALAQAIEQRLKE